jgi:amino acid adenylation domain-containing protein
MRAEEIVATAAARGCYLYVEDGKLRFRAAEGALTDALRELIVAHRDAVIAHLQQLAGDVREHRTKLPDLLRRPPTDRPPLSHAQQRLWFIDRLNEGSVQYNLPSAFRMRGALDVERFLEAIRIVIRRHEVLRTRFREECGRPFAEVRTDPPLAVRHHDLLGLPEAEREQRLRQLIVDDASTPFRLDRDLLLRVAIVRLAEGEHAILFNMHHIVSDAWSLRILIGELSAIYPALCAGAADPLPPLTYQYADYAHWQQGWLRGEVLQEQLAYWKRQLAGAPTLHGLPLSHPRPERQSFAAKLARVTAPAALTLRLHALCQRCDVTLFMLLQTAFAVLLGRYAHEEDIVIGTPVAGRAHRDLEPLIGFFVNILVLRTDLSGAPGFEALLLRNKATILAAYDHQSVSFDTLVEELKPVRSLAHSPIFQIMLTMQQKGNSRLSLGPLQLELIEKSGLSAPYDLELSVLDEQQLQFSLKYAESLFDASFANALVGNFLVLLESIVADPGRCIHDLEAVSVAERMRIESWSSGERLAVPAVPLHALVRQRAADAPARVALHHLDRTLTFAELETAANRLAGRLREEGVSRGDVVALCLERTLDMPVCLLAVLKAGAAYLPLDPHHPEQRIAYMIGDAGAKLILAGTRQRPLLVGLDVPALYVDGEHFRATVAALAGDAPPADGPAQDDLAYVIYTSGSTGLPKGVMIEHRQLANFHRAMQRVIEPDADDPVWLAVTNYCFDISILELVCTLASGFTVVLADERSVQASQGGAGHSTLTDLIENHAVTHFQSTPSLLSMFVRDSRFTAALGRLRQLLVGGEAMPPDLLDALLEATAARIDNMYGPTETTIWSTTGRLRAGEGVIGIGRPLANTRVHVLDDRLRPLPVGVPGELCIGGDGVARGYRHRPELTAERFVTPEWASERLYRTGDKAFWREDGSLGFLGRFDHQIKLRGFRIELGEIEATLSSHPAVVSAAVLPVAVAGDTQLAAYVAVAGTQVPEGDARQDFLRGLKAMLARSLPDYMIPAIFVLIGKMPLNSSGKIDRKALPAPEDSDRRMQVYAPPRNDLEQALCALWQELLGVERVGIEDNFFELGGHSLLSTRMISRIRDELGIEAGVAALFEHPTIAEFAGVLLARQTEAPLPAIEPAMDRDHLPLSYAQQRLWIIDRLEGQSAQYNMPYGFTLKGGIDRDTIERTLRTIIERHESLRTRFYEVEGEVCQHIDRDFDFRLVERDLTDLPYESQRAEIRRISIEDEKTPFDLGRDLMIRAQLLILSDHEHVLLFNIHHIASDGWSMKLLVLEFYRIYTAYLHGRENPLSPLALQYGDYARWQREWLSGEVLEAQIRYWQERLRGIPRVHRLPLDKPRPKRQTFNGDSVAAVMGEAEIEAVRGYCQRCGVTMFMFMQTAFAISLARFGAERDIVMGTVVAGRGHKDVEPIIGFFLNTIVLRTRIDGDIPFEQLLQANRRDIVDAYAHQQIPFDMLVERIKSTRSPRYNPVFQVMVSLLDDKNEGMALSQADLQLEIVKRRKSTAKFELVLNMTESDKGMKLSLVYNTDLFLGESAEGLLAMVLAIAADAVAAPATPVGDLPLSGRPVIEVAPDVHGASTTTTDFDGALTRFADGRSRPRLRTWRDGMPHVLDAQALRSGIAQTIRLLDGLPQSAAVAVRLEPAADALIAALAVLYAGRPLIVLTEGQDERLVRRALIDGDAALVLGPDDSSLRRAAADAGAAWRSLVTSEDAIFSAYPEVPSEVRLAPGQSNAGPRVLLYSRDTQGRVAQRSIVAGAMLPPAFADEGAVLLSIPGADAEGLYAGLILPLLQGQDLIALASPDREALDAVLGAQDRAAALVAPEHLPSLLEADKACGRVLHRVTVSGAAFDAIGMAGNTAAAPGIVWGALLSSDTPFLPQLSLRASGDGTVASTGMRWRPDGFAFRILDDRGGEAPIGCFGALHARPPDAAIASFSSTGLAARRRGNGTLEVAGPTELQWALAEGRCDAYRLLVRLRAVEGVRWAGLRAEHPGADAERILVCTQVRRSDERSHADRQTKVERVLSEWALETGTALHPITVETLPLTAAGDLDWAAVPILETRADRVRSGADTASETERALLAIWRKVLGDRPLSVTDNFFAAGGNSLLMILAIRKMADAFDVDIPMATFMSSATIEELAQLIDFATAQRMAVDEASSDGDEGMQEVLL